MTAPTLASLLIQEDQPTIYAAMLQLATTLGLPVTSWQPGDPTRSQFAIEATELAALEQIAVYFISAGFLDELAALAATDPTADMWLTIVAQQFYNVTVPAATFATTSTQTLTNTGGAVYGFGPGDLVFKNSTTGATYHNTSSGTLTGVGTPGATLTGITVVADVAGSASSASVGEIDTLVTGMLGVTTTNTGTAIGLDVQSPTTTVQQCRNKQSSFSPNGPASAYQYVATTPALTGTSNVTQARVYPSSQNGSVLIYLAGPSGPVAPADVTAVQNAINTTCTPLCITPTAQSCNGVTVNITYNLWVYKSVNATTAQIQGAVATAIQQMFAARPIGGDVIPPATSGSLYVELIESTIRNTYPGFAFRAQVTSPSSDLALGAGDKVQVGTITGTINVVPDPT